MMGRSSVLVQRFDIAVSGPKLPEDCPVVHFPVVHRQKLESAEDGSPVPRQSKFIGYHPNLRRFSIIGKELDDRQIEAYATHLSKLIRIVPTVLSERTMTTIVR